MLFLRNLPLAILLSLNCFVSAATADERSEWSEKFAPFVYREDDPSFLILAGEIDIRTSLNFSRFVLEHGVPKIILLNSPGGIVHVALDVALKVDALAIATAIPEESGCYSACAFIFLAGSERYADGDLGVHQINSAEADLYDGQLTLSDMIDVLNQFNTPAELLVPMLSTPPEEMYILSQREIEKFQFNGAREQKVRTNEVKVTLSDQEEEALLFASFVNDIWSGRLDQDPIDVVQLYASEVQYYGKLWSKNEIVADKIAFANRWPVRDYKLLPQRSHVACSMSNMSNFCSVRGLVEWRVENPEANKTAAGESQFDLLMRYENERFFVVKEDSIVIKRQ